MRGIISAVIVSLIVILSIGMLLPRLRRGREDASRVWCLENLRGLHEALYLYHEWYEVLPPAVVAVDALPPEKCVSWQADLLPFLGEYALAAEVHSRPGWPAPANAKALQTRLPRLRCPSGAAQQPGGPTNLTHYLGLAGMGADAATLPLEHPCAGCFGYQRLVTLDYIRAIDGTSATILLMETGQDNGPWLAGGPPTTRGLDPSRQPYLGTSGQFGGTHAVGAHALFADGSARMQTPAISPRVLEALVTLGGN